MCYINDFKYNPQKLKGYWRGQSCQAPVLRGLFAQLFYKPRPYPKCESKATVGGLRCLRPLRRPYTTTRRVFLVTGKQTGWIKKHGWLCHLPWVSHFLRQVKLPHTHFILLLKTGNSRDLKTNKQTKNSEDTGEQMRCAVSPMVPISVSWPLRDCTVWYTYHSSHISHAALGSMCSSLPELFHFLHFSRTPPAQVIPFARKTPTHRPSHWDLKSHFLRIAFLMSL